MGHSKLKSKESPFNLIRVIIITMVLWALGSVLTLTLTGIIYGFGEVPPIFVAFHLVAFLYAILFFIFFVLTEKLFWLVLPSDIKKLHKNNKSRFRIIVLLFFAFFVIGSWLMNHYFFDYKFNLTSLLANLGISIIIISLALLLLNPSRRRYLYLYSSGFVLIASILLSFVTSGPHQADKPLSLEALKALPYAKWAPPEENLGRRGVTKYIPGKSFKGVNIYVSRNLSTAYLMDMDGNILHTWSMKIENKERYEWAFVKLLQNGDLLEIAEKKMLLRMDWNSNIKWIKKIHAHHYIDVNENNDIYTLSHNYEAVFHSIIPMPIGNEYLVILSPEGKIKKKISLYKILKDEIPDNRFTRIGLWLINPKDIANRIEMSIKPPRDIFGKPTDIFHSNCVEIINKDINDVFKKGNVLISSRHLNLVGIIDVKEEKLVWSWGRNHLEGPHHPTPLEDGNILIFDNGLRRKYSRVIELNPQSEEIIWQYVANPPGSFYSSTGGKSQRLPNGNTLITDTKKGRVFEITRDREIVWEFYNTEIDEKEKRRATIFHMTRITDLENYPCLRDLGKKRQ